MSVSPRTRELLLLAAVAAALAYGTLFPLSGWRPPAHSPWREFLSPGDRASFGDIITNFFVYIPLGFALTRVLPGHAPAYLKVILAAAVSALFSVSFEFMQAYLPNRVSSYFDVVLNALGASVGALLAVNTSEHSRIGRYARDLRESQAKAGMLATLGLAVTALWIAAQLLPFVPSLDVGNLKQGLKPIVLVLERKVAFSPLAAASYAFGTLAIAVILRKSLNPIPGRSLKVMLLIVSVLLLKIVIVGRQLSAEAVIGAAVGLALFTTARYRLPNRLPLLALIGVVVLLIGDGIRVDPTRLTSGGPFNWIPFRGHLANDVIGMADLLGCIWPYSALAVLVAMTFGSASRRTMLAGLAAVCVLSFTIEWYQRFTPGRLGDITDVVIAAIAWSLPWVILYRNTNIAQRNRIYRAAAGPPQPGKTGLAVMLAFVAAMIAAGGWLFAQDPVLVEQPLDESKMYKLPEPAALPPVQFEQFRFAHPRLPVPSTEDLERLRAENPRYLKSTIKWGASGRGKLPGSILAELAEPGSQNLDTLYERLRQLEFTYRGNNQLKPLAMAYDWLYDRWSPEQRRTLLDKTLDGCEFTINVIREQRLSPYNVYLYNSPLQALVACAIATYGDAARADPVMRFAHDLWNVRVLPVWRQVMGRNGGWHEGGEYVGIGIGNAIYQVPAMWRRATGEDAFKSEPGIAGFLDFLIYRTRPDGTHVRWGDAGHFNRAVPDGAALAMEYGRSLTYGQSVCGVTKLTPSAWPWGPLVDKSICARDAAEELPLTKLFDGIGLIVTRSDWGPEATFVTFNAGDNYWSHTHLDQGAFTIFKRAALAIDSGVYGTGYGTDHHMDYAYQSIAHNLVTVTDPEDTVPAPNKDGPRSVANDGGQRRIGSGWGIEAAPLDLDEWMEKQEIYHTGTIVHFEATPDYTIATADLTVAYTNAHSGADTFSHRTKRVEEYFRTFVYDRKLDSIAIHDRVHVTDPTFKVRWLLHTQTRPAITDGGFDVEAGSAKEPVSSGNAGLIGHVILPREHDMTAIGGPGFEFFVDGRNYDESGKIHDVIKRHRNMEPGAWRIELAPKQEQEWVSFLVVMFPWTGEKQLDESVNCDEHLDEIVCRVDKRDGHAEYKFSADNKSVRISYE